MIYFLGSWILCCTIFLAAIYQLLIDLRQGKLDIDALAIYQVVLFLSGTFSILILFAILCILSMYAGAL